MNAWYFTVALFHALIGWIWHLTVLAFHLAVGIFVLGLLIWLVIKLWRG